MAETGLDLPLVTHRPQSFALGRCQLQVDFSTNHMNDQRYPGAHAEGQSKGCRDEFRTSTVRVGLDDDGDGRVGTSTLWIDLWHGVSWSVWSAEQDILIPEVAACLDIEPVMGLMLGNVFVCSREDYAQGDDACRIHPGAYHPRAMLVDLQAFDVDVGQYDGYCGGRCEYAKSGLGGRGASSRLWYDYICSSVANQKQQDNQIPVEAVEYHERVTDDGNELKARQETRWQYRCEVEEHSDTHPTRPVIDRIAWNGML